MIRGRSGARHQHRGKQPQGNFVAPALPWNPCLSPDMGSLGVRRPCQLPGGKAWFRAPTERAVQRKLFAGAASPCFRIDYFLLQRRARFIVQTLLGGTWGCQLFHWNAIPGPSGLDKHCPRARPPSGFVVTTSAATVDKLRDGLSRHYHLRYVITNHARVLRAPS